MIIQHNLSAGNTERQMGIVKGVQAQSMQCLSSGYRINQASNDAAGLSISEKMRKQIRGINMGDSQYRGRYIPVSGWRWSISRSL